MDESERGWDERTGSVFELREQLSRLGAKRVADGDISRLLGVFEIPSFGMLSDRRRGRSKECM